MNLRSGRVKKTARLPLSAVRASPPLLRFAVSFGLATSTDGVDADLADLDARLGIARADAVELLVFLLER